MARSTFVYVTYIRTTPEKLWSALTDDAEFMKQYWFGVHCESRWTAGSEWKMVQGDDQVSDDGEIVEADPPRRLVIRWRGGEAFDYPYDRARTLETHRRRVGRLAEDHLQSEVLAGDGLRRSVGGLSAGQSGISEGKKVSWKIFWRSERDSQTVPDTNGTYLTPV